MAYANNKRLLMARPFIKRRICCMPEANYFKPSGIPLNRIDEISLTFDEYEALRLGDLEELYQEDAAKEMNISRQTFGNIIHSAHKKIAESIVYGKAIKIEGGEYKMEGKRTFICSDCEHEWEINYGTDRPTVCPKCGNKNFHRSPKDCGYGHMTGGMCRGRHGRRSS